MSVKEIQELYESKTKKGVGFGIRIFQLTNLIYNLINNLSVLKPGINEDVLIDLATPEVRFSFKLNAKSLNLSSDLELTLEVEVWLHPAGDSTQRIVTFLYLLDKTKLVPSFDNALNEFTWRAAKAVGVSLVSETPIDGAALIAAGYINAAGMPDLDRFNQQVYVGFKFINARGLLSSIVAQIPFPQIHKWFLPFVLRAPFFSDIGAGYILIWTENVTNVLENCGATETPAEPVSADWKRTGADAPGSLYDGDQPDTALFISARNLVSWHAGKLAPAVMLSDGGGGFVRWRYDIAAGVRSIVLDLEPNANGGTLSLHADLRLFGSASAWIDGPSGVKLGLANSHVSADGEFDASLTVTLDVPALQIALDAVIQAQIKKPIDIDTGGLIGEVFGELVEILINRGVIKLGKYVRQLRMPMIDLGEAMPPKLFGGEARHRIGESSLMSFYNLSPG